MNRLQKKAQEKQAKRGRQVFIIEIYGTPDAQKRHAYMTKGTANAALTVRRLGDEGKVVRYVPEAGT